MVCSRFPELAKYLQTKAFSLGCSSQPFRTFAWVAARLLHAAVQVSLGIPIAGWPEANVPPS